jgi:predicted aldo/keto reductase-like oxidoreductase
MDECSLNNEINKLLADYSDSTEQYFCRRCGVCDTVNADSIPIFDIMELLMYLRGYVAKDMASKKFEQIPVEIRHRIDSSDYSGAEKICPQKMPITQFMNEAYVEFSK